MSTSIIIVVCLLLLIAYTFDISSRITKIPAVILLLLLGWTTRHTLYYFDIHTPDLGSLLPLFGTIGLILIVLEGALEIELDRSKLVIIKKSLLNALFPMLILAIVLAFALQYAGGVSYKVALTNAIPFCVISSAIAIPSVKNFSTFNKEFVIYESSFSDIFGVLLFNFIALNDSITMQSFGNFTIGLFIIVVLSFIAVLGLSFLLSRINHQITYTPIILMIILIYAISKVYHLPGLVFILVFGLFLGNLEKIRGMAWIQKFRPNKLDREVSKFKEITIEATFFIRALFFVLFGFLMEADEILNINTIPWAIAIVLITMLIRWIALRISKIEITPILFVAPKGLITILLFLSILPEHSMSIVSRSLISQTIILSILVMMIGIVKSGKSALTNAD